MSVAFQSGRLLFVDGKLAFGEDCCCGPSKCYPTCFYATGSTAEADEPGVSPPLSTAFSSRNAVLIYHGHAIDEETEGEQYHTHLWVMQMCVTPISNRSISSVIDDYVNELNAWVANDLSIAWCGMVHCAGGSAGDASGTLDCTDTAIEAKADELLTAPVAFTREDLFGTLGSIEFEDCSDCEDL